jgi:hypothetical protein
MPCQAWSSACLSIMAMTILAPVATLPVISINREQKNLENLSGPAVRVRHLHIRRDVAPMPLPGRPQAIQLEPVIVVCNKDDIPGVAPPDNMLRLSGTNKTRETRHHFCGSSGVTSRRIFPCNHFQDIEWKFVDQPLIICAWIIYDSALSISLLGSSARLTSSFNFIGCLGLSKK